MHTDKNAESRRAEQIQDVAENSQDSTLRWLLEMDMSEPEERLFTIDLTDKPDTSLSDYELDVASRPMTRGSAGADDLENYVDEEIVISSDNQSSDIYAGSNGRDQRGGSRVNGSANGSMAVDYSRESNERDAGFDKTWEEGSDILGLADDDDMGEKFLVIKRVKAAEPARDTGPGQPPLRLVRPADLSGAATDSAVIPAAADELTLVPLETATGQEEPVDKVENVFGYIASVAPPAGDEAFDNYLLEGNQLQDGGPDFDGLAIEPKEGATAFDTSPGAAIDYPEDFHHLGGRGADLVAAITPILPRITAEITAAVTDRLVSLELAPAAVLTNLQLGVDLESVVNLMKDGFEPAVSVCVPAPASFRELGQEQVDAVFVRLVNAATGQPCNELFSEEFEVPADMLRQAPVVQQAAEFEAVADVVADAGADVVADFADSFSADAAADDFSVFADDLLSSEGLDEIGSGEWQPDDGDIDDIFADFGEIPAVAGEQDLTSSWQQGNESVPAAVASLQVFEDDIFADDLSGELDGAVPAPQADIEALFDSLGQTPEDGGEVCGLDLNEFPAVSDAAADGPLALDIAVTATPPQEVADKAWCIPEGIRFAEASPGGGEIFADFLDAFLEEGASEIEKLEDAVAVWERDATSEPAYAAVTRILHTVKGIAKGVGLQFYGTLIHNFETLLGALARPQGDGAGDYFRIVNAWLDAAVRGIDHISEARADIANVLPGPAVDAVESLQAEAPAGADIESSEPALAVPTAPADAARERQQAKKIADDGARVLAAQQSVRITSEKLDHLLNLTNQAQQLSVRTAQSVARGKRASVEMHGRLSSVRSHIASIADRALRSVANRGGQPGAEMDALEMDQYSELQEAANILREGVEDLADLVEFATRQNSQVQALLKQQTNVISSIGSSIRAARVVPVSRLVPGLRRLVRTVSVDLGKTVAFQVLNELGTLDRDDYARCQTILDHMVRNALDHGIESTEERLAAGKAPVGQVTIDIRKAGADAIITLADDGRGIDPEKMRESACRKGLAVDVDTLSDEEAVRLIFHKGFSTANSVSQISGRGVGMDIVLTELQEMGGDIQIDSVPGRGTSFHIRVPSSITVNGALLVSAGEQSYAIPLGGLVAVEQVPVADFFAAVENKTPLLLAGMSCEPAYLATLCQAGHFADAKTWRESVPVIIAGSPERYMAIAIDDVEEALELVIRSLGTQFSAVPGVAGAATTAAGEAIVALDLNLLVASVGESDHSTLHVDAAQDDALLALVVDDSRTQRMVATSQLETVGVETLTAENGAVAIDLLNTADRLPDIILLDVEMPVKDGIQTLREIRKSVRYGHIPVIMITSRTGLKHRALAQQAGCNGYMGKPFNFRMLIGQINELTGHRLQLS